MFSVELLAQAETELSEAYDWYEEQQAGLGQKFFLAVSYQLSLIEERPFHYPVKYADILHVATVKKFPFLLIFWIDEPKETIFVVSVFHTSRRPRII